MVGKYSIVFVELVKLMYSPIKHTYQCVYSVSKILVSGFIINKTWNLSMLSCFASMAAWPISGVIKSYSPALNWHHVAYQCCLSVSAPCHTGSWLLAPPIGPSGWKPKSDQQFVGPWISKVCFSMFFLHIPIYVADSMWCFFLENNVCLVNSMCSLLCQWF